MSNFKRAVDAIVVANLEFGSVSLNSINQFTCKNGEIAGFKIIQLDGLSVSEIYDCTSGNPVLIGSVSVLPGCDLCGGYFSSGVYPDSDISETTKYYKVNY